MACDNVVRWLDHAHSVDSRKYQPWLTMYAGEVSSVLAEREVGPLSVLRRRPDGRVQHAAVHSTRVQDHGRTGNQ